MKKIGMLLAFMASTYWCFSSANGDTSIVSKIQQKLGFKFISPKVAFNDNDKFMVGLGFHHVDTTSFSYSLDPLYSFKTGFNFTGFVNYRLNKKGTQEKKLDLLFSTHRFSYFENIGLEVFDKYNTFQPTIKYYLSNSVLNENYISLKLVHTIEQTKSYSSSTEFTNINLNSDLARLSLHSKKMTEFYSLESDVNVEYFNYESISQTESTDFIKTNAWAIYTVPFKEKYHVSFRAYLSYFLANDNRKINSFSNGLVKGSAALIYQGINDYAYEHDFLSRFNQNGFFKTQIGSLGGGFKNAPSQSTSLGQSNDMVFALNGKIDLPLSMKYIQPLIFTDFGAYSRFVSDKRELRKLYSLGLGFENKYLAIYIPIINHSDISQSYITENRNNFFKKISFQFFWDRIY